MLPKNSTNLRNRVSKLHLPRTKPLLPLFEVVSNAIHAISEKQDREDLVALQGKIEVNIIRYGEAATFETMETSVNRYRIESFIVTDNGIGFDVSNMNAFAEFDTDKKATMGGKGVGRLVCLKAFENIIISSVYQENAALKQRKFNYKKTFAGFENYQDNLPTDATATGSSVELHRYEQEYRKFVPTDIMDVAREMINHFQLYFIQGNEPSIIIINQDRTQVNLTRLFETEFATEILSQPFEWSGENFRVIISKSYKAKSHKLFYCAHYRSVKEEGIYKYIEDLRFPAVDGRGIPYFFQVFVVGTYLDKNVSEERTGFKFDSDDEEAEDILFTQDISLARIRKGALGCVENLLSDYLTETRKEKLESYTRTIEQEFPNYLAVVNHNREKVGKLPAGLTQDELDIKLYEIESEWRMEVKRFGKEVLAKKKDLTTYDEYKDLYERFLSEFNEIGQSDLTRYVVHRRAVIDLLDQLIGINEEKRFVNEDIIHSLFFPIKETKHSILHEKQNLWLLDERLTFNSLLASDKTFNQISEIDSTSLDRMDLIVRKSEVFDKAALFAEERTPFESFTIVEFKKPERDDYIHGNPAKDPVKQVRSYIDEIVSNKAKIRGRSAGANERTPFYCYIVADITEGLLTILMDWETFIPTADGLGYFRIYDTKSYKAYIEVLPFNKVIKDAKQRNKILFDKLKLS